MLSWSDYDPIIVRSFPSFQSGFRECERCLEDRALLLSGAVREPKALQVLGRELADGASLRFFDENQSLHHNDDR